MKNEKIKVDQNKLTELFEVPQSHPGVDFLLLTGRGKGIKIYCLQEMSFRSGNAIFIIFI